MGNIHCNNTSTIEIKYSKMANNKNESKGSILSSVGGLFVIIGIVAMTMKSSNFIIFPSLIIGIILAAYGVVTMSKPNKTNDK